MTIPNIFNSFQLNSLSNLDSIAKRYYQLSSLKQLTLSEEEELCDILNKAEENSVLSCLISEIDNDLERYFQLDEKTIKLESSSSKTLKALMAEWNLKDQEGEFLIFEDNIDNSGIDSGIFS